MNADGNCEADDRPTIGAALLVRPIGGSNGRTGATGMKNRATFSRPHPEFGLELADEAAGVLDMTADSSSVPRPVPVRSLPIELSQFLKFGGLAESGGAAKQAISEGLVSLNGAVETQKGKKLKAGDRVTFQGRTIVVQLA
jgi:ribosome-associated protein